MGYDLDASMVHMQVQGGIQYADQYVCIARGMAHLPTVYAMWHPAGGYVIQTRVSKYTASPAHSKIAILTHNITTLNFVMKWFALFLN